MLKTRFRIDTQLSKKSIESVLQENTEVTNPWQYLKDPSKPLKGHINENQFTLALNTWYANGSFPLASGTIEEKGYGSVIEVSLHARQLALPFLVSFVFALVFLAAVVLLLFQFNLFIIQDLRAFILIFILSIPIMLIPFYFEKRSLERTLVDLLEGALTYR
ncbi:MAG: hypothetical protein BRD49_02610 [Bacteroidetes bacterium SW_10_40_5]|nr:MAG: hypothetical protein BRD49_02610 [Bacteroidetes bacterium SW_10_40_5]